MNQTVRVQGVGNAVNRCEVKSNARFLRRPFQHQMDLHHFFAAAEFILKVFGTRHTI